MKRPYPFPAICILILAPGLPGLLPGQEHTTVIRALLGDAETVVRGTALDQEPAPGGLWHRFHVQDVLWTGDGRPVDRDLRIFALGPGMCDGPDLPLEKEIIIGINHIPPDPGQLPAFQRNLLAGFHPDRPGELPYLAVSDGMVVITNHPEIIEAVTRLVQNLRDPAVPGAARRELLMELARHEDPAVREESIRQLGKSSLNPGMIETTRLLESFREEVEGPGHRGVLSAYIDLLGGLHPGRAGRVLASILRTTEKEEIANRSSHLLARMDDSGALRMLSLALEEEVPAVKVRILRTLALHGGEEYLPVFERALNSHDRNVRRAAAEGMSILNRVKFRPAPRREPVIRLGTLLKAARKARQGEPGRSSRWSSQR